MLTAYHTIHPYGHCATICPHNNGYLLAYYSGPECQDKQKVHIKYIEINEDDYRVICGTQLYHKTGNCVLLPKRKDKAVLIYSYFNDTDGKRTPTKAVHRWMYCSNWVMGIEFRSHPMQAEQCANYPRIETYNIQPLPTQPATGFLTRINPIKVQEQWILPAYHENICYGQIMKSFDGVNWRTAGHIGLGKDKLIQPSLWWDGGKLNSLSRDMSGGGKAWYSHSYDFGETWSPIKQANITNENNSIAVIDDGTANPYVIWNQGKSRYNLILGRLKNDTLTHIMKLNKGVSGSYPNYCVDGDNIHIVHTEHGIITHHVIKKSELSNPRKMQETVKIIKC